MSKKSDLLVPINLVSQAAWYAQVEAQITAEPVGIIICHNGKDWRMFRADAWTPHTDPLLPELMKLPWCPPGPEFRKIMHVDRTGTATLLKEENPDA